MIWKAKIQDEMEIKNATDARNVVLDYFKEKGMVILSKEIVSIFKRRFAWFLEIESKDFTGIVVIKSTDGKIITEVKI